MYEEKQQVNRHNDSERIIHARKEESKQNSKKLGELPMQSALTNNSGLTGNLKKDKKQFTQGSPTVTIPSDINSTTTPVEMNEKRIPPTITYNTEVSVSGLDKDQLPVVFKIEGFGHGHGKALLNNKKSFETTESGSYKLSIWPESQTRHGKSDGLKLVAYQGDVKLAASNPFSIASIPQNWSDKHFCDGNPDDPLFIGFSVIDSVESDSGYLFDLNKVDVSEKVETTYHDLYFKKIKNKNSDYYPATLKTKDSHGFSAQTADLFTGTLKQEQLHVFKDARTGVKDIPVPNSGFKIEMTITPDITPKSNWRIDIKKYGADAKAKGFESKAGNGIISSTFKR
jgi:hypothetical protein